MAAYALTRLHQEGDLWPLFECGWSVAALTKEKGSDTVTSEAEPQKAVPFHLNCWNTHPWRLSLTCEKSHYFEATMLGGSPSHAGGHE